MLFQFFSEYLLQLACSLFFIRKESKISVVFAFYVKFFFKYTFLLINELAKLFIFYKCWFL